MRLTHTFSWLDVRIIVSDNVTVMAHKAMLAFRFPPFAQAFKPVPAEEDVTLIATGSLLSQCYHSHFPFIFTAAVLRQFTRFYPQERFAFASKQNQKRSSYAQ